MKRRDFFTQSTVGILGAGLAGCSSRNVPRSIPYYLQLSPVSIKPIGTMPMGELGKTGIKVSKFAFGSHMPGRGTSLWGNQGENLKKYDKQREYMVREAYDLGINTFDVYDKELECHQYEPMGRHLNPMINDVVISIAIQPYDGRTLEQEFERDLRAFGKDCIDMVRIHAYTKNQPEWAYWDKLFAYKDQGKIRAVGIPLHFMSNLRPALDEYPIDFVIFPYNFYHNLIIPQRKPDNFDYDSSLPAMLREKGIGIVTMKPFTGEYLCKPLIDIGHNFIKYPEMKVPQAMLRHVMNSEVHPDTTFGAMFNLHEVYEDVEACYAPEMSDEEKELLNNLHRVVKRTGQAMLPDHYKWLENWAHHTSDDDEHHA